MGQSVVFIVGSPRSGTSILEIILNTHPFIAAWYEPYYLWETYFSCLEDDIWREAHLEEKNKRRIRDEFEIFSSKSGKPIVLDKLPTHSFNIPIIRKIFPDAKWIHILRDGRDVTLSIKKKWEKRSRIVQQKNLPGFVKMVFQMLQIQPFWRYRFMAIVFELRTRNLLKSSAYFNKSRWAGEAGWGPRFSDWRNYLKTHSTLEFNAMQWVHCVNSVRRNWPTLPDVNKIEIRYESLLREPEKTLMAVFETIGVECPPRFFQEMPNLKSNNVDKWRHEFNPQEIQTILPILNPVLKETGYIF